MDDIKIEIYMGSQLFREISAQLKDVEVNAWYYVYTTSNWFISWLDTYDKHIEICTVVAKTDDEIIGFLPLCRRRSNLHGLYFKITEPLSGAHADYHCPVIKEGFESNVLPLLLEAAWNFMGHSGTFIWPNIANVNPSISVMRGSIKKSGLQSVELEGICPRIAINGDYQFIQNQWKKNHRTDVRRQRLRLSKQGHVELWIPQTLQEAEEFLPEFFEVYTQKWLSQKLPSKMNYLSNRKYIINMVRNLWGKGLHISTLQLNGQSISFHLGFFSKEWLLWYMPTYRIEYSNFSPTKLHISYLIEKGVAEGWKGIDFLQGDESYKLDWANELMTTTSFIVGFTRFSPSYHWFSYGKELTRQKIFKWYMRLLAFIQKIFKRRDRNS